jgi:hypothetical protein
VQDNHYIEQTLEQRVMSTLFDRKVVERGEAHSHGHQPDVTSEIDCCMHIDADGDDVNQQKENKLSIELSYCNETIFANQMNNAQSNNASSGNSFEVEADELEDFDMYDVEYHVTDPKACPQYTTITILDADMIGCCQSCKILKVLLGTWHRLRSNFD